MDPTQGERVSRVEAELKRDSFGCVELLDTEAGPVLRRWARGGRLPGSRWVAGVLARRERRALERVAGQPGIPVLLDDPELLRLPGIDGRVPREGECFLRAFVEGAPLHLAERLPVDFFDQLDRLVEELHARGVCHNDLHKEQNIVVDSAGYPALIDFQLASVHRIGSRGHRVRSRDDLRHVQKHRRRYLREGRGPAGMEMQGKGHGIQRSFLAALWRRLGKPIYNGITRGLLRTRDGEARRPSEGPWPAWTEAVGPRPGGPTGPPPPPPTHRAGPA